MELQDNYDHISKEIFYITENIAAGDFEQDYQEQMHKGCVCENECVTNHCTCLAMSGAVYKHKNGVQDTCNYSIEETDENKPIYECNSSCKCRGKTCGNRLVQFGPRKHLQITDVGSKGLGLKTTVDIARGNFICEYAGEIISQNEAKRRYVRNKELGRMNYIFCVNEHFGERTYRTYIDPSVFGNIGRYINHSCQANCVLYPVRVNSIFPKLCIFAKTDIHRFSEITFDYGDQNATEDKSNDLENRVACLCNTSCCRKYLPYCPTI